jgi:hypothetical protein
MHSLQKQSGHSQRTSEEESLCHFPGSFEHKRSILNKNIKKYYICLDAQEDRNNSILDGDDDGAVHYFRAPSPPSGNDLPGPRGLPGGRVLRRRAHLPF